MFFSISCRQSGELARRSPPVRRRSSPFPASTDDLAPSLHFLSPCLDFTHPFDTMQHFILPQVDPCVHDHRRPPAGASPASNPGRIRPPRMPPSRHRFHLITVNAVVAFAAPGDHRSSTAANARAVAAVLHRLRQPVGTGEQTLDPKPPDLDPRATVKSLKANRYAYVASQSAPSQPSQPIRDSHVARDFQ